MSKLMFGLVMLTAACLAQGGLNAANWKDRAVAFQAVAKSPLTPQDQQRIVALLERENKVVADALSASGGKRGVSSTIGEDYSEYYSAVLSKVADIAKNGNDAAIPTLVKGAYNSDSTVGTFLVDKWPVTLPLYAQASSEPGLKQVRSLQMMGLILGAHRGEIDADRINLAETRLADALNSKSTAVRIAAIRSNVQAGSTKGLEMIKRLAVQDTAQTKAGKQTRFPVREEATKAVQKLEH